MYCLRKGGQCLAAYHQRKVLIPVPVMMLPSGDISFRLTLY
ncbi:hypothetical protein VK055_5106 [Klebsiella pneumoniae subsp. pneumoniae]|nr:hypothetical protein VK055_5106 [Klebsiella pneumoniae subsp. pneumoniae]